MKIAVNAVTQDEMLWEPRSEVYFAQKGNQMGKYLMKDNWSREQCAN